MMGAFTFTSANFGSQSLKHQILKVKTKGVLHSAAWQPFWYTQVYSCKFYNEMFEFLIPRSNFGSNTVAISEWGEEGTATELERMGETSNNLKTGGKKLQLAMTPI